ncbi:MAG TPA: hypothetical protein VFA97_09560 [Gaiellaceae bacterium]|nr:hypothetical protein [Gaiellaceae bacterium]
MTEPIQDPPASTVRLSPVDAQALELARKNLRWGWALVGVFIVLFAGTVGVAFVYLWLS